MAQFHFMARYTRDVYMSRPDFTQPWVSNQPVLDASFKTSPFFNNFLSDFLKEYWIWLDEMSEGQGVFKPFALNAKLSGAIQSVQPKEGFFEKEITETYVTSKLNKWVINNPPPASAPKKYFEMFFSVTKDIVENKFNNF
jgi:hypothetical protein